MEGFILTAGLDMPYGHSGQLTLQLLDGVHQKGAMMEGMTAGAGAGEECSLTAELTSISI